MELHQHRLCTVSTFLFITKFLLYLMPDQVIGQAARGTISRAGRKPVNVVLLVPNDSKYMFSYAHVYPALEIAIEELEANGRMLPGYYLNVRYSDTQCDEALGMKHAVNYFFNKQVDVFFGPICDYVIAPVLRQLTFWNLPMISAGANAWGFVRHRRSKFQMLTRVGPVNHHSLVSFFVSQIRMYHWQKIKVLYDKHGQDSIVTDFCHLSIEVLVNELRSMPDILKEVAIWKFEDKDDFQRILMDVIGLDYGGESWSPTTFPPTGRCID